MARTYSVVMHGVAAERRPAEVANRLALRFNMPTEQILPVLEVHGSPFKRGLDYVAAVKLRVVLEQCGCRAMVEAEAEAGASAPAAAPSASPASPAPPAPRAPQSPKPAVTKRVETRPVAPRAAAVEPAAAAIPVALQPSEASMPATSVPEAAPPPAQAEPRETTPAAAPRASIASHALALLENVQDRLDDLRDLAGNLLDGARSRKGIVIGVLALLVVAAGAYFVFLPSVPVPESVASVTRGDIAPSPAAVVRASPPVRVSPPAQSKAVQAQVEAPSVRQCTALASRPAQILQTYDAAKKADALTACSAATQSAPKNANVRYLLGDAYSLNGEFSAAIKNYKLAADLGNPKGFTRIGSLYYFGAGVAKNPAQAMKWFRLAADKGEAGAMRKLGIIYETGNGVAKDPKEAVKWFRQAAEKGDAASMTYLGDAYRNAEGVTRDYKEAMKWFRQAADKGDAAAMTNVGNAYHNAEGVDRDYEEAMKWFRLGADKGDAGAMRNIGICYENGDGVARDAQQARRWYLQAEAVSPGIAKDDLANLDAGEPGRS
jgi:TPR repeat protein